MPSVFKYNGNEIIDSSGKLGASTMDANQACVKTALNASGDPPIFAVRAWVNFNGENNTSNASALDTTNRYIRASGNVTSVLRNGQGDYTITFTTAMPDTNYAVFVTIANYGTAAVHVDSNTSYTPTTYTTTQVRIAMGAAFDSELVNVIVVR